MPKTRWGAAAILSVSILYAELCFVGSSLAAHPPAAPIGVWRGTSTCTDLKAAPACKDEVVIYEVTAGAKPGTVHCKADKVFDGERGTMGELEFAYDASEGCWKADFISPRTHVVWCLKVDGSRMTGTGSLLPGKEAVRRLDLRKDGR